MIVVGKLEEHILGNVLGISLGSTDGTSERTSVLRKNDDNEVGAHDRS